MPAKKLSVFLFVILLLFVGQTALADRIYTSSVDFDEGELINVNSKANEDQLQLDMPTISPFVYVAASGRGTVVRIDADSGNILGEYLTTPEGTADDLPYPSRTSVDSKGNVWITNWFVGDDLGGSVVKIGLVLGGTRVSVQRAIVDGKSQTIIKEDPSGQYLQGPFRYNTCVDRDNDGLIKTSTGLDDVFAWKGDEDALGGDTGEVQQAQDECILLYQRLSEAQYAQHVSVDADDNVWVGGYPYEPSVFYKLSGDTAEIIDRFDAKTIGCGGWGGLVDGNGILWSASIDQYSLMYYDPDTGKGGCISVKESYGLGVDGNGFIWNSLFSPNQVAKINPFDDGGNLNPSVVSGFPKDIAPANRSNASLAITPADNHVWIAKYGGSEVTRLNSQGDLVKVIDLGEQGKEPTGVAVDARGKVWVTNLKSRTAMRIDPGKGSSVNPGEVDLTVFLGDFADPDNYGNMTGAVAPEGTWTVIHDSQNPGNQWGVISWNSSEPEGTRIVVAARAAETEDELGQLTKLKNMKT